MIELEELEKLQELVRLVELEFTNHLTEGQNGYCADDESVSAGVAGDSPLTFGHIRRARAAVNALPELVALRGRVESFDYLRPEVQAFARRMEDALRRKDSERGGNSWQKRTLPEEILPHLQDRVERIAVHLKTVEGSRARGDEILENINCDYAAEHAVHAANFALMIADICAPLARTVLKEKPQ